MAPREHLREEPGDVSKLSARPRGHAQRAEEDDRPDVAREDRPADEERELHEERQDAEGEEGTRDDGGDGARGDRDAHGGEGDSRAAHPVHGVVLDVRVGQVHAVIDAEPDDDDRGDGLRRAEVPAHDPAGADADDGGHDTRDCNRGIKREDDVAGGHGQDEEHHREAHGEAEVDVVHEGDGGDGPEPEDVGAGGLRAGELGGSSDVQRIAKHLPVILRLGEVHGRLGHANARRGLDQDELGAGHRGRVAVLHVVPHVPGVANLGRVQLAVLAHLDVEGIARDRRVDRVRAGVRPAEVVEVLVEPADHGAGGVGLGHDVSNRDQGVRQLTAAARLGAAGGSLEGFVGLHEVRLRRGGGRVEAGVVDDIAEIRRLPWVGSLGVQAGESPHERHVQRIRPASTHHNLVAAHVLVLLEHVGLGEPLLGLLGYLQADPQRDAAREQAGERREDDVLRGRVEKVEVSDVEETLRHSHVLHVVLVRRVGGRGHGLVLVVG